MGRWSLLVSSLLAGLLAGAGLSTPAAAEPGPVHWAFQTPRRVELPRVKNQSWVRTSVDAFILAGLERAGLAPAPALDRAALLRRVTFDLIGLPPTPEESDAFLKDERPD